MNEKVERWNKRQQALRQMILHDKDYPQGISLFFDQHAAVHASYATGTTDWSYEDEIWDGMQEAGLRLIPERQIHSIVWCLWHTARIEDVAINLLLSGMQQVFLEGSWQEKLGISARDTGNLTTPDEVLHLSEEIDLQALKGYRFAVAEQTRGIVSQTDPARWQEKVNPDRLKRVLAEGAVNPVAQDLLDYWGSLTLARLLLMPPTRHQIVHLNEAAKIKQCLWKNIKPI